jgi:hypothetical protein
MPTYKKLGSDRVMQNIASAINSGVGSVTTGNITRGEVVDVAFDSSANEAVEVGPRRTGAIPIELDLDGLAECIWSIDGNTLNVLLNIARTGTCRFWVF